MDKTKNKNNRVESEWVYDERGNLLWGNGYFDDPPGYARTRILTKDGRMVELPKETSINDVEMDEVINIIKASGFLNKPRDARLVVDLLKKEVVEITEHGNGKDPSDDDEPF